MHTDVKETARLNLMRHLLSSLDYDGKAEEIVRVDEETAFNFSADCTEAHRLAQ